MSEADDIIRRRVEVAQAAEAAEARRVEEAEKRKREDLIGRITRESRFALALLQECGYPDAEALKFSEKKGLLGGYKDVIRAGWKVGEYYFPGSNAAGPGTYPIHLLSDGQFARFRGILCPLVQMTTADLVSIVSGLAELRSRLESS